MRRCPTRTPQCGGASDQLPRAGAVSQSCCIRRVRPFAPRTQTTHQQIRSEQSILRRHRAAAECIDPPCAASLCAPSLCVRRPPLVALRHTTQQTHTSATPTSEHTTQTPECKQRAARGHTHAPPTLLSSPPSAAAAARSRRRRRSAVPAWHPTHAATLSDLPTLLFLSVSLLGSSSSRCRLCVSSVSAPLRGRPAQRSTQQRRDEQTALSAQVRHSTQMRSPLHSPTAVDRANLKGEREETTTRPTPIRSHTHCASPLVHIAAALVQRIYLHLSSLLWSSVVPAALCPPPPLLSTLSRSSFALRSGRSQGDSDTRRDEPSKQAHDRPG